MSSSYSPDLRIELIGTGDQAGVWGSTTNNNLGTFIENAVAGYTSVSIVASPQALTANDGAADEARFAAIALTTTTGANFTVCIPPNSKLYTFYNASSYVATISNSTTKNGITLSGGTTIAIPAGKTMSVWSDGTNVAQQTNHLISPTLASPTMTAPVLGTPASGTLTNATGLPIDGGTTGTLPVNRGGTGVTTSTGSGNVVLSTSPTLVTPILGTPTSGTLTNATGLPIDGGTTGTLPVNRGGTGATSLTSGALLKGAGTGAFSAASAADIVGQIGATAVQNATTAANGGVTSVNGATGALTLPPLPISGSGVGAWAAAIFPGQGQPYNLPGGDGTYAYFCSNQGAGFAGVAAAGTQVLGPSSYSGFFGFTWRIT